MPFRIALSGLNAATSDLNVTANNIANSNTTGFKASRTEFSDVFTASGLGSGGTAIGNGVRVAAVTQQLGQGAIQFTNNNLDLAISGEGFFALLDPTGYVYTRNGAFGVDRDGYIVNSANQKMQVYPAIAGSSGTFNTGTLTDSAEASKPRRVLRRQPRPGRSWSTFRPILVFPRSVPSIPRIRRASITRLLRRCTTRSAPSRPRPSTSSRQPIRMNGRSR